ncbi:MAG: HEAT repeat domain-containing protein, partial [Planctomycetota bacterium]
MFVTLPLAAALVLAGPPDDPPTEPPPPDGPKLVAGRTLDGWAQDLSSESRIVRNRAVLSLRAFGAAAAPELVGALEHEDEAVRFWAAEG